MTILMKNVIVIEDELSYREGFIEFLESDASVIAINDPDDFAEKFTRTADLKDIYLIVVDFRFENYDAFDKDLLTYIRDDLQYAGYIVLWSLEEHIPLEFKKRCDAVLPKKFMTLEEIEKCIN